MSDETHEFPLPEEPVVAGDAWSEVRRIERRNLWLRWFVVFALAVVLIAVLFVVTPTAVRTLDRVERLSETSVAQLDRAHHQLDQAQSTLDRLLTERQQLEANIAALRQQVAELGGEPLVGPAGPGATDQQIAEAVAAYCAQHDGCAGPSGPPGPCVRPNGRPC